MFPLALLNASSPPVDPALTLVLLHFDTDYTDSSQTAAVWSNNWILGNLYLQQASLAQGV